MGTGPEDVIDCAIIGGGMGGVYSAWRLATAPESRIPVAGIHLFEMSDRIGGRLDTVRLPGMPHVPAELGGMRIMTSQPLVMGLVKQLGSIFLDGKAPEGRVFFAGEHCSLDQAWIQGALIASLEAVDQIVSI